MIFCHDLIKNISTLKLHNRLWVVAMHFHALLGEKLLADRNQAASGSGANFFCIFPSVVFFIPREQQVALAILNHRSEQKYLLFFSFG